MASKLAALGRWRARLSDAPGRSTDCRSEPTRRCSTSRSRPRRAAGRETAELGRRRRLQRSDDRWFNPAPTVPRSGWLSALICGRCSGCGGRRGAAELGVAEFGDADGVGFATSARLSCAAVRLCTWVAERPPIWVGVSCQRRDRSVPELRRRETAELRRRKRLHLSRRQVVSPVAGKRATHRRQRVDLASAEVRCRDREAAELRACQMTEIDGVEIRGVEAVELRGREPLQLRAAVSSPIWLAEKLLSVFVEIAPIAPPSGRRSVELNACSWVDDMSFSPVADSAPISPGVSALTWPALGCGSRH